jgi:hypothetical protein
MKREWKNEQKSFRDNLDVSMSISMTLRLIINEIRWHV